MERAEGCSIGEIVVAMGSGSLELRRTNSLRRTLQIVECSLLCWWAQGRVSS